MGFHRNTFFSITLSNKVNQKYKVKLFQVKTKLCLHFLQTKYLKYQSFNYYEFKKKCASEQGLKMCELSFPRIINKFETITLQPHIRKKEEDTVTV